MEQYNAGTGGRGSLGRVTCFLFGCGDAMTWNMEFWAVSSQREVKC